MSKKELSAKIRRQKIIDKLKWFKLQIKECANYIEVGTLNWLREMCYHAVKHLILSAKQIAKKADVKLNGIFNFY